MLFYKLSICLNSTFTYESVVIFKYLLLITYFVIIALADVVVVCAISGV